MERVSRAVAAVFALVPSGSHTISRASYTFTLDGRTVFGIVTADSVGFRVRVSIDEFEQLGLVPGQQVHIDALGQAGTFLLTATDQIPPFVWLRLLPLASRIAG
jgi:hypothetical protein